MPSPALSVDLSGMPHVEGTRLPGAWNWDASVYLQLADRPYYVQASGTARRDTLVAHQLWSDYLLQLGLSPGLALGLDVPVLLSQSGDLGSIGQGSLATVGFGDLRALLRWSTRPEATPRPASSSAPANSSTNTQGPALGIVLAFTVPTGDPHALTGTGAWVVHPSVVGDFRLFDLVVAAQLGYRARLDGYWPTQGAVCAGSTAMGTPDVACLSGTPLRDAITWSAGARLPEGMLRGAFAPFVEIMGSFDGRRPFSAGTTVFEAGLGIQRRFGGELTGVIEGVIGAGDAAGTPRARALLALQWSPRRVDEDGDGLLENTHADQCAGLAEDFDGYQDDDGCPEDNDNDDIPDAEDRCPSTDEDVDGFQDEDGCPDPDNDNDGVLDAQDACPGQAAGEDPDPVRTGCPSSDADGDGVPNASDACPRQAPGAHSDPARPGCPAPDSDGDGLDDTIDACPRDAVGDGAAAEQLGCPERDHDHDGVLDAADRCTDRSETINGVDDGDGCPEVPVPPAAHPRIRIVRAGQGSPGGVELLEAIQFDADDHVAASSQPALAQLALGVTATARVPRRYYTLTVNATPASVRGPNAVDAARAERRRDAVLSALRALGVAEWTVRAAPPGAAPTRANPNDRGIVLLLAETMPVMAATASPAPASASPASASSSASPRSSSRPTGASRRPSPAPTR